MAMKLTFKPREIDDHVLKLTVGLVALGLPCLTSFLSANRIESISASYYEGGWASDFFIGCLFAISSFMFAYNGYGLAEMVLSKIVALAGLGVALFPCGCGRGADAKTIPHVHYIFAAIMFGVLAGLCIIFYRRARAKPHRQAKWRSHIYAACAIAIVLVIAVLGIDNFTGGHLASKFDRLTFFGEWAGLLAFGISWLVASRALPFITAPRERVSLLPICTS
jgi:Protein of unknown function (DUF998)